jgi:peptide/nickel transport system permease protein
MLALIPVVIIISMVIFGMLKVMPGRPELMYVDPSLAQSNPKAFDAQIEQIRRDLGLDDPIPVQYFNWVTKTASGDLGESLQYSKPVVEAVGPFIKNTIILNVVVILLSYLISIPIGILSAVKKDSFFDNFWGVFSLAGISVPGFYLGLVLIFIFGVRLNLLPMSGMVIAGYDHPSTLSYIIDVAKHMVMPVIVLTVGSLASTIRYVRNAMLDVIKQDYIRTARSKGLSEKVVIYSHAFRNALIPVVTLLAFSIPALFGGAAITEQIFKWPGIGSVLFTSLIKRDFAIVLALNMFYALLALLANILMDIGYALVDPRVKLGG